MENFRVCFFCASLLTNLNPTRLQSAGSSQENKRKQILHSLLLSPLIVLPTLSWAKSISASEQNQHTALVLSSASDKIIKVLSILRTVWKIKSSKIPRVIITK